MNDHSSSCEAAERQIPGLTPVRRRALDILTKANRPVGAYDLMDLMASVYHIELLLQMAN